VFERLGTPFCCYLEEERRRIVRYVYGELLGSEPLVEALKDLEPSIPWNEEILRARRDAYRSVRNPLSRRAEEEWRQFREQAKSSG
jgi:hypothetical protein